MSDWWQGGMSDADYRKLVSQWNRLKLVWTKADVERLKDKVRKIKREGSSGPVR